MKQITGDGEIDRLLEALMQGVRDMLGRGLLGLYLEGSLAAGDFDRDSDIDFVAVTARPVTPQEFQALQAMHDRLARMVTPWAIQLEGFYVAVSDLEGGTARVPNIERGPEERLKWVELNPGWAVHRWLLRERGIPLFGPQPIIWLKPVSIQELKEAGRFSLQGWMAHLLEDTQPLQGRGFQSYVVLTLCRILYTFHTGELASKHVSAEWAREALDAHWRGLIDRAWDGRHSPDQPVSAEEVQETQAFIRHRLVLLGTG